MTHPGVQEQLQQRGDPEGGVGTGGGPLLQHVFEQHDAGHAESHTLPGAIMGQVDVPTLLLGAGVPRLEGRKQTPGGGSRKR